MPAGVCFKTEHRGWMQDQWSWVFSNFGIVDVWERDRIEERDAKIYQAAIGIDTAAELPASRPLIVLSPLNARYIQGDQPLVDFVHPVDAIYLFGGSQDNLSDVDDLGGRLPDALVYIETTKLEMYAHAAAYITLYDRFVKRGDFG